MDDLDPYDRQRRYERREAQKAADIGTIPAVVDPVRREACRRDLLLFLTSYFPASTGLSPFSDDHKKVIGRIQRCILDSGLFGQAVYRGFAKTTIAENSAIWAVLYGHRRFVPVFGADAAAAEGNIDSIKIELSENDLLYADFPEVCHAIRALDGKSQRCQSQTYQGELTHIEWRSDTIVLPTIKRVASDQLPVASKNEKPGNSQLATGNYSSAGAIITARGIMAGCRGMKHKRPDGTQQRPDFVILDDPQTDESAASALQVNKRLDTIRKSILKLGGHSRRMAVVMNATVIRPDDLVERILDPKQFPAWQGERIKMVTKWAKAHETLWLKDYQALRNTYDPNLLGDQQRAHRAATEFYKRNRAKMDAGCVVSWEYCFDRDTEISAIQHAYNALIDDGPEVFASECQNEPLKVQEGAADALTADFVAGKVNGYARGLCPAWGSHLVVSIDVMKNVLFWMAAAVADDFSGAIVDYGTYPEQKGRKYFSSNDVRLTLAKATGGKSLEETIYAGLDALVNSLMSRDWKREDGAVMKPEKIVIDANWGDSTNVVYEFCRQSPHMAVLLPAHGKYFGARSNPINQAGKKKQGDRVGPNWQMPGVRGGRQVRYVVIDTNYWKSFMQSRLRVGMGGRGCWSVFGKAAEEHRMLADHLTSEVGIEVEARGRKVVEWKLKPGRENHWLDTCVYLGVASSVQGVSLREVSSKPAKKVRVKLSEIQRAKGKN